MDEATKKEIAVFRFGVIADIVGRKLARGEKERIIREKASCRWEIPFSTRTRISRSTILSWERAYARGRNLESGGYGVPSQRRNVQIEKGVGGDRVTAGVPPLEGTGGVAGLGRHPYFGVVVSPGTVSLVT